MRIPVRSFALRCSVWLVATIFFLVTPTNAQTTLAEAGPALMRAYKKAAKLKDRANAYLTIAMIYEDPLRQYQTAIAFYQEAMEEAGKQASGTEGIRTAAATGKERAIKRWLGALEETPLSLEMSAATGTVFYVQPSQRNLKRAGAKLSTPHFVPVYGFAKGYCRVKLPQGKVVKEGWFRLDTVDEFRLVQGTELSPGEKLHRYEEFLAQYPSFRDSEDIRSRMDRLFFEDVRDSGNLGLLRAYLERFPNGAYEREIIELIEDSHFNTAQKSDSRQAYETYMEMYPAGRYTEQALENIEDLAFSRCASEAACADYIREYPNGRHVDAARVRMEKYALDQAIALGNIDALKEFTKKFPESWFLDDARREIRRLEFLSYAEKSSIASFEDFIATHPESEFVQDARKAIDDLQFQPYRSGDTIEGYLYFKEQFPTSTHLPDAQRRIEDLQFEPYRKKNTSEAYTRFLSLFPSNRHAGEARRSIAKLDGERVRREVERINRESRSLGNRFDVTFSSFSKGLLIVKIPQLSAGGQFLRLIIGGVDDVTSMQHDYEQWRDSIISRLKAIRGVREVIAAN